MRVKAILLAFFCAFIENNLCFTLLSGGHEHDLEDHNPNVAGSQTVLDSRGNLLLKWTVDYSRKRIRFTVHVERGPVFSWFAIGFSDYGDLTEADVCLLWIDYRGTPHFDDTHSDDQGILRRDRQQDCENFSIDDGSMSFERKFDTCDIYDYLIEDGTTHIIWARGQDTLYTPNGLSLMRAAEDNKGMVRVRLLSVPRQPLPTSKTIKFLNHNLRVPKADTTYWCKVFRLPNDVLRKEHHIVQFESAVQPGNDGLVHHMEVFHCDAPRDREIPLYEGNCFSEKRPEITKTCSKVKAAWAMGALPFTYPKEAGLPLGGPHKNKYVLLEVHYNNPEMRDDWVDSSGMVLHITPNKRQFEASIMELGLEYTDKMAIPALQQAFTLTGHCVPECTGVGLPHTGIIVFGSQLHTHLTGIEVYTRHFRNGKELPMLNEDRHYSTHFQEIRILHKPVRVLPGDYLQTSCVYKTLDRNTATVGGHSISDEMCVNYIHYYPATPLEVCKSSITTKALYSYFDFENRWDEMNTSRAHSPRENYEEISPWTQLRVDALTTLYEESPLAMQCNKSDGSRFQGEWDEIPIPKIKLYLSRSRRNCGLKP